MITNGMRNALLSLIDVLTYRATWDIAGYDYSDWDVLQSFVATLGDELMKDEKMSDITEALDRIAIAIDSQGAPVATATATANSNGGSGGCCAVEKKWRLPDGWETDGNWPDPPAPTNTPMAPPAGYLFNYQCDASHQAYADYVFFVENFARLALESAPYQDIIEFFAKLPLLIPRVSELWEIFLTEIGSGYGRLSEDSLLYLSSIKDDYICALSTATDSQDAMAKTLTLIRDSDGPFLIKWWIETIAGSFNFNELFDGSYIIFPEFEDSICICGAQSGNWVESLNPVDGKGPGSYVNAVITSDDSSFSASGYITPEDATGGNVKYNLLPYYDEGEPTVSNWQAVSFTVISFNQVVGNPSKKWILTYGGDVENTELNMAGLPLYRVLVRDVAYLDFDTKDYDLIVIAEVWNKKLPRFLIKTFTYQPEPTEFELSVVDWRVHVTPWEVTAPSGAANLTMGVNTVDSIAFTNVGNAGSRYWVDGLDFVAGTSFVTVTFAVVNFTDFNRYDVEFISTDGTIEVDRFTESAEITLSENLIPGNNDVVMVSPAFLAGLYAIRFSVLANNGDADGDFSAQVVRD